MKRKKRSTQTLSSPNLISSKKRYHSIKSIHHEYSMISKWWWPWWWLSWPPLMSISTSLIISRRYGTLRVSNTWTSLWMKTWLKEQRLTSKRYSHQGELGWPQIRNNIMRRDRHRRTCEMRKGRRQRSMREEERVAVDQWNKRSWCQGGLSKLREELVELMRHLVTSNERESGMALRIFYNSKRVLLITIFFIIIIIIIIIQYK